MKYRPMYVPVGALAPGRIEGLWRPVQPGLQPVVAEKSDLPKPPEKPTRRKK